MELDVTTFVLEIVNFLVLLWLLSRFFYRPMQAALQRRAAAAAAQAQAIEDERSKLQAQARELQQARAEFDAKRAAAEHELASSINAERNRRLAALAKDLEEEREKAHARLTQEQRSEREHREQQLRQEASAFVARYLRRLATPALEAAVVELFLADIAAQPEAARAALREGWTGEGDLPASLDVVTAFPPPPELRARVDAQVSALMGAAARTRWHVEPGLLAGVCVHLPGHQLEASLRRGVDAFAQQPA